MADWSTLPAELLHEISLRLPTPTSLLRFRSVCSTWRSSTSPPIITKSYPILPNSGISDTSWGFRLSKRTIYALQSPNPQSWMIKIQQTNNNLTRLLYPLTRSQYKPLPNNFPNPFDFINVRVEELGQEFTLQYINFRPSASNLGESGNLYMEKVAVKDANDDGFVLVTIHVSGKLVIFTSGWEKWRVINDIPSPYDDVVVKAGVFYAVDNTGRLVVVDVVELSVEVVAGSVFGGDKKFLCECEGELLLVDMYLSIGPEDDLGYNEAVEFYEDFDCFMSERTVKFKVFRLDECVGKWVEVSDLGDKMLFLGDNCLFSASASDFCGDLGGVLKGNRIFFTDHSCSREDDRVWKGHGIGVFDLESGSIGPMDSDGGYCRMFWPPPDWVYSGDDRIEVSYDGLGSVKNMRFPDLWRWKAYPLICVLFGLFIAVLTTALWQIVSSLNL